MLGLGCWIITAQVFAVLGADPQGGEGLVTVIRHRSAGGSLQRGSLQRWGCEEKKRKFTYLVLL